MVFNWPRQFLQKHFHRETFTMQNVSCDCPRRVECRFRDPSRHFLAPEKSDILRIREIYRVRIYIFSLIIFDIFSKEGFICKRRNLNDN